MKIVFVMPCVGKLPGRPYVKTWQMEPLGLALLSALTPKSIERVLFDDRMEEIDYTQAVDLVAITVETYTARRAYQIAERFRKRGIPVVLGGFHVTLNPDECAKHGDTIVIGQAEDTWPSVLRDYRNNKMKPRYTSSGSPDLSGVFPDRTLYGDRPYSRIALVESARGCRFSCEFCSISSFFQRRYIARPTRDVIEELSTIQKGRIVFFVDDNFAADITRTKEICRALRGKDVKWVGQVSIQAARDEALLKLMKESGCLGVLIGFESLDATNLACMNKGVNSSMPSYAPALKLLRKHRLVLYATFVFGYDNDTAESFRKTLRFALRHRFFFTAFNHLVPFPGTRLYDRLCRENRLLYDQWWLSKEYRFGEAAFRPKRLTPEKLALFCLKYRKKMYSLPSILYRAMDFRCNLGGVRKAAAFFVLNALSGRDVDRRQDLPLGVEEE